MLKVRKGPVNPGKKIYCTRCGELLTSKRVVTLELSITDGRYYEDLPEGHESQGGFDFGAVCARHELEGRDGRKGVSK